MQVLAHTFAAGLAHWTVGQTGTTKRRRNADAVAAFFAGDVAAGVVTDAASEFGRSAADVGFLITLARSAAQAAAAVELQLTADASTEEARLHAGEAFAFPAERTFLRTAAFCTVGRCARGRATAFFAFAGRNAFSADTGFAWTAGDRLANTLNAGFTCVAVGQTGTAKSGRDTNAVAAFFLSRVATVAGAAGKLERFTADARVLIALARWAAGGPAAAVVRFWTAQTIAKEFPHRAGLRGSSVQTGGGRTPKDGAPEEAFEYLATRKPSGQRTRQCVEAPVVHRVALLIERILFGEVRPILLDVGQVQEAHYP